MKPISGYKVEYFAIDQLQSLGLEYIHSLAITTHTAQIGNLFSPISICVKVKILVNGIIYAC